MFFQYNYNFFSQSREIVLLANKRRKATESRRGDAVFTAGMATSSICPSTVDNFDIRRGIPVLRQEYILLIDKQWRTTCEMAVSAFSKFYLVEAQFQAFRNFFAVIKDKPIALTIDAATLLVTLWRH